MNQIHIPECPENMCDLKKVKGIKQGGKSSFVLLPPQVCQVNVEELKSRVKRHVPWCVAGQAEVRVEEA